MTELVWACTMCGYCDGICPKHVRNVELVLHLRRELHGAPKPSAPKGGPLVLGCTIRERAAHLVPSIQAFLRKIGRDATVDEGCCGALDVQAGRATPARARAGVVVDPVCSPQFEAEHLGELAMRNLGLFELKGPFFYHVPHQLLNADPDRYYPLYDALRRTTGCATNLDLNRLARSTSMGSLQGLSGKDARDVRAAVKRLLAHAKVERVITCSPADYLAYKEHSGLETRFITECLK